MHGRGGVPLNGVVAARLDDGRRAWGIVKDPSQVEAMVATDVIGTTIDLQSDGTATLGAWARSPDMAARPERSPSARLSRGARIVATDA